MKKGIQLPYRSDRELEAIFHREDAAQRRRYRIRALAKQPCSCFCRYTKALGLIPEVGCPIHDKRWVR